MRKIYFQMKRTIDILFSLFSILLLLPIIIFLSIWIKADSLGPVFYKQERIGYNRKSFSILKFRTMTVGADKHTVKYQEIMLGDVRITNSGKFLRRFKLDEIVQLWNVLIGDMSLIGPRPIMSDILHDLEEWELERFSVKPGMTGLAQINGNIYLDRPEKSFYDVEYIKNLSLFMDIRIVFKTIIVVMYGEEKFLRHPNLEKRGTI